LLRISAFKVLETIYFRRYICICHTSDPNSIPGGGIFTKEKKLRKTHLRSYSLISGMNTLIKGLGTRRFPVGRFTFLTASRYDPSINIV